MLPQIKYKVNGVDQESEAQIYLTTQLMIFQFSFASFLLIWEKNNNITMIDYKQCGWFINLV